MRDLSERLCLTSASKESVRIWVHRFSSLFRPSRGVRRFGNRNRIERWFREVKERTKRFYNNVNSKKLKCLEELGAAIAAMHNIIRAGGEEVIPT